MGKTKTKVLNQEVHGPNQEVYEEIFQIVKNGNVYYIGVNDHLISKKTFETIDLAKKYIDQKPWDLIVNVTCLVYDLTQSVKINKK